MVYYPQYNRVYIIYYSIYDILYYELYNIVYIIYYILYIVLNIYGQYKGGKVSLLVV